MRQRSPVSRPQQMFPFSICLFCIYKRNEKTIFCSATELLFLHVLPVHPSAHHPVKLMLATGVCSGNHPVLYGAIGTQVPLVVIVVHLDSSLGGLATSAGF